MKVGRAMGGCGVGRDESRPATGGHGCSARASPPGLFVNRACQVPVLLLGRDTRPCYDPFKSAFIMVRPPEVGHGLSDGELLCCKRRIP
jgi:hypothetical protein